MYTILYLDDNKQSCKLIKYYLEKKGFSVLTCQNTGKARETLSNNKIDAIITDIGLPGENGLDFYNWLQEHETYQSIPVLMVSAHAFGFDEVLTKHKDIFLSKPIFFPELIKRLNNLIEENK